MQKTFLVVGTGKSGVAAVSLLSKKEQILLLWKATTSLKEMKLWQGFLLV